MIKTTIPGLKAKHAIVTPECVQSKGSDRACEEALDRLRAAYLEMEEVPVNDEAKYHFVLTVER